ncbi:MAG: hypothetical protein RIR33_347 [Pseudomonadota bacterium]|jgi:hypothetical protein
MIEVLRTNNPVRLDYAVVLLTRAGCQPFVADQFMASAEGGISAFERRILVPDEYAQKSRAVLQELDRPAPENDDLDYGEQPG